MEQKINIGAYAGSFSPPHKGHFEVVKRAIGMIENCSKFIIFIASGTRDGITQDDSYNIWSLYKKYLPDFVEVIKGNSIKDVYDYAKKNPEENVYFVVGSRKGNDGDVKDSERRSSSISKYPNLQLLNIPTGDDYKDISGTYVRSISNNLEELSKFLPEELDEKEIEEIYNIISPKNVSVITEGIEYNDYKNHIAGLTSYALEKGMNVKPFPKVIFKHNDEENAKNFLGRTAYYDPTNSSIILFTLGRDPIAIVNSYSHNLIHHIQNLENRYYEPKYLKNIIRENKYNNYIDIKNLIVQLENYMDKNGYHTEIKPKVKFIHNDIENAKSFFGKTAYYNPTTYEIVLYIEGRHPRDIISSYCHERIHHSQNIEGRLNIKNSENVYNNKELEILEREAYENGGFMLRAYKDFIKSNS